MLRFLNQMNRRWLLHLAALSAWGGSGALGQAGAAAANAPALMLAKTWRPGMPLKAYWVSEKYDGVRGYWDGRVLRTRGGTVIATPAWFTDGWPTTALDGELWAGRGGFSRAVSAIKQPRPDHDAWRQLRYMVFDLPTHESPFGQRLAAIPPLLATTGQPWLQAVTQNRVASPAELRALLGSIVDAGGEGLMLHHDGARYRAGRSDALLKLKPWDDAEAQVVAHVPGRGRHAGRLGALQVRTESGHMFRLGSGLSDAQRETPPPIGSWVTFRHQGTTDRGLPRFASYLRQREDF